MSGWPTTFATLSPMGGEAQPVAGTGTDHKTYFQVGGELHLGFEALAARNQYKRGPMDHSALDEPLDARLIRVGSADDGPT
jgi:hypothetical protein